MLRLLIASRSNLQAIGTVFAGIPTYKADSSMRREKMIILACILSIYSTDKCCRSPIKRFQYCIKRLQPITNHIRLSAVLACLVGLSLTITNVGCNSYGKNDHARWRNEQPSPRPIKGVYSPNFIFDRPTSVEKTQLWVNSEQFGRDPWPISPYATAYIDTGQIITYGEYRQDDQYINSDNIPRNRFYRRLRGYRTGQIFR